MAPKKIKEVSTAVPSEEAKKKQPSKRSRSENNDSEAIAAAPPSKKAKVEKVPTSAASSTKEEAAEAPLTKTLSQRASSAVTAEQIEACTVPFVRKTSDVDFSAPSMLKIVSWNVAGLRALLKKEPNPLHKFVDSQQPDILCLQETKLSDLKEAATIGVLPGYVFVDSVSTAKKGYSGTRTYVKSELTQFIKHHCFALDASKPDVADDEGRVLSTFFELKNGLRFVVVNTYVPNSGMKLERLEYRTETYDVAIRKLLKAQYSRGGEEGFQVVWVGDLNVAERDYDRYFATNFKAMQKVPGFTPEERASFRKTLADLNMVDSFRHLYPNARGAYTFFSAKFNCRKLGNGWRLDYAVVSQSLVDRVVDSFMLPEVEGSDHSPVVLWLKR